ncbi:hypothetical protein [Methylobacterium sp. Leaf118]|uniref:hypothetical protein n=1 Tax=Methylobacterium sp. Leaf118 TaxID=2876562 RepID=UPI001E5A5493|nr:hypothetical protein [Methylobacterium sp. Leaf118]
MATSYKGSRLCPPKQARPSHVRVADAEGGETMVTLETDEARAGQPPWQSLPWQGEAGLVLDDGDKHSPEIRL